MTHICVNRLTIIGSDNGLSPGWRQAIICTSAVILLIGPIGTNFNEMSIEIHTFSFKKIHLKMSFGKWRPFCLGLNVLNHLPAELSVKHENIFAYLSLPKPGESRVVKIFPRENVDRFLVRSQCHGCYRPYSPRSQGVVYMHRFRTQSYHYCSNGTHQSQY